MQQPAVHGSLSREPKTKYNLGLLLPISPHEIVHVHVVIRQPALIEATAPRFIALRAPIVPEYKHVQPSNKLSVTWLILLVTLCAPVVPEYKHVHHNSVAINCTSNGVCCFKKLK
jgi:hypothetical protein